MKKYPTEHNTPIDSNTKLINTIGGIVGLIFNDLTKKHDIGIQFQVDENEESDIFLFNEEAALYMARMLVKVAVKNWFGGIFRRGSK